MFLLHPPARIAAARTAADAAAVADLSAHRAASAAEGAFFGAAAALCGGGDGGLAVTREAARRLISGAVFSARYVCPRDAGADRPFNGDRVRALDAARGSGRQPLSDSL